MQSLAAPRFRKCPRNACAAVRRNGNDARNTYAAACRNGNDARNLFFHKPYVSPVPSLFAPAAKDCVAGETSALRGPHGRIVLAPRTQAYL